MAEREAANAVEEMRRLKEQEERNAATIGKPIIPSR
jgi:hypothetical protein